MFALEHEHRHDEDAVAVLSTYLGCKQKAFTVLPLLCSRIHSSVHLMQKGKQAYL